MFTKTKVSIFDWFCRGHPTFVLADEIAEDKQLEQAAEQAADQEENPVLETAIIEDWFSLSINMYFLEHCSKINIFGDTSQFETEKRAWKWYKWKGDRKFFIQICWKFDF